MKGLEINCELDKKTYPTGIIITNEEMDKIKMERNDFHGSYPEKNRDRLSNTFKNYNEKKTKEFLGIRNAFLIMCLPKIMFKVIFPVYENSMAGNFCVTKVTKLPEAIIQFADNETFSEISRE